MPPAEWKFYKDIYPILDDNWTHTGSDSIRGDRVNWEFQIESPDPYIDITAGILCHPTWPRVILRVRHHIHGDGNTVQQLSDNAKAYSVESFQRDCETTIPEIVKEVNASYQRWLDGIRARRKELE